MMSVNLHHPTVQRLHEAVEICYNAHAFTGMKDTDEKKVAVFVLAHFYGYKPKDIALPYCISYLYVPTVVAQLTELYGISPNFQKKVQFIMDYIEKYDKEAG